MNRLKTLGFKAQIYLIIQILLLALILPGLAFSQTSKTDKITWVKSTENIVDDLNKTDVSKGDKLFVLHNGQNDPLLNSINKLKSHYELIFHNYGANDEVNNLEMFRNTMKADKMNILVHSNNPKLPVEYLNKFPDHINLIVMRGETNPQIDLKSSSKSLPITKEQLFKSSKYGNSDEVSYLLKSGIDPNFGFGEQNQSPLLAATLMGHLAIVRLLVENGAKVSDTYSNKYIAPPIWHAANNGDVEIVKYLLEQGADPMSENREGWTPLRQAKHHNHTKVIEHLEKAIKN